MSRKTHNRTVFTAESARKAQPLAVKARAATDAKLRLLLAEDLAAMPIELRRAVVERLPITAVVALRLEVLEHEAALEGKP